MKYYEDGRQISFVGVDISKAEGYVDFNKLKKAGIDFVMLRVGARGYSSGQLVIDEYFSDNIKRATDAKLEVGLYFFSQAITEAEAIEEALVVLQQLEGYTVKYPIAFDMEYVDNDTSRVEGVSRADKTTIAKAFLDTVRAAGYEPMIYGDKQWLIKQIDLSKLTGYDVWLSQLEDVPDYPYRFSMWQYSRDASIDGISGYANLNISFIDYSEK
ncbi:MAG: glycoside hydrolase family 25 protein [Acetatifactor sp.]|nr:glycoside hydrolase family 25 protein [Acetatifactor sp.]